MLRNLAMAIFGAAVIAVGFSMTGIKVPTVHTWVNWMPIVGFATMVVGAVALLGPKLNFVLVKTYKKALKNRDFLFVLNLVIL